MNWLEKIKSERGSATLEFLGIVPLALLLLVIIIQFVVIINAAVITQSAANEAASVYSVTDDPGQATNAAKKIVNASGNYLTQPNVTFSGGDEFNISVGVQIKLIFLPDQIGNYTMPLLPHSASVSGRVIK